MIQDQNNAGRKYYLSWNIYGSETGDFLLVQGPPDQEPRAEIGGLTLIGNLQDLLRTAGRGYKQRELSDKLGFKGGTLNGYMFKPGIRPSFSESLWRELVWMYFHPREVEISDGGDDRGEQERG